MPSSDRDARRAAILERYRLVRARTVALATPLALDEQLAQAFPDASPTKWHLGHTSWFFDRFVLAEHAPRHAVDPDLEYVFNSYYEAIGERQPRHRRSLAVRPTLAEVHAYRRQIDDAIERLLATAADETFASMAFSIVLGTHHEEQHQELLLTDVKPVLAGSRVPTAYPVTPRPRAESAPLRWEHHDGGLVEIGHAALETEAPPEAFAFDNESPRHRVYLEPFAIASRPVTVREYLEFVEGGGYEKHALWLSDGWATLKREGWRAPEYWRAGAGAQPRVFELGGERPLDLDAPVCHLSYYEADAFARWAGARLPSEAEWEISAAGVAIDGNLLERGWLHPGAPTDAGSTQRFGDVWEWTASSYAPYPRYRVFPGAFAEYNGKFMSSQVVLRGGSCLTPRAHVRATYRNFFPPPARWQMTGLRLAKDVAPRRAP